jgi:hypothetical protein
MNRLAIKIGAVALALSVVVVGYQSAHSEQRAAKVAPPSSSVAAAALADAFPAGRWVRTRTFAGKPFVGFAYVDRSNGHCIKGEETDGRGERVLGATLGDRPATTLAAIPASHVVRPLDDGEVAKLGLPARPSWLRFYQPDPQ